MKKKLLIFCVCIAFFIGGLYSGIKTNATQINIAEVFSDQDKQDRTTIHIQYEKQQDYLIIGAPKDLGHRVANSIELFIKAFNLIRNDISKDFSLDIETGDYSNFPTTLAYSYRGVEGKYQIPDFAFIDWPEFGIINYDDTCKEIEEAGKKPYIYNKMFWPDIVSDIDVREKLVKIGENNGMFEFLKLRRMQSSEYEQLKSQPAKRYMSLFDYTQYKYLLDVPDRGYSAKGKLLLFSMRPLFYVERKENEFYFKDLVPFVHYIPVKADLSDLAAKYNWAEDHPKEVRQIAQNALLYAKRNLTTRAIIDRYASIINKYVNNEYYSIHEQKKLEEKKKRISHPEFLPSKVKRY